MKTTRFTQHIPALFHPATTIGIDDKTSFLDAMTMYLLGTRRLVTFENPNKALEYLAQHDHDFDYAAFVDKPSELAKFLAKQDRFYQVATIMCDFYMPYMDGDAFYEKLRAQNTLWFKGALLTGATEADMKARLEKRSTIDMLILKNDIVTRMDTLGEALLGLEADFFEARYNATDMCPITQDSAFIAHMNQTIVDQEIAEGYLLDTKGTYYLIKQNGEGFTFNPTTDFASAPSNTFEGETICAFKGHLV